MMITVALIGHPDPDIATKLKLEHPQHGEADTFDAFTFDSDRNLQVLLINYRPHVLFTFGDVKDYPKLNDAPLETRRRWVHYDDAPAPSALAESALIVFLDVATHMTGRFEDQPLVSVYTSLFNTPQQWMHRAYTTLKEQSYTNWEWCMYDDSPDTEGNTTLMRAANLSESDDRIRVFSGVRHRGIIGEAKRRLCGFARGSVLVELDHDDELTWHCLADIVEAFNRYPAAGFAYTDCAEVTDKGEPAVYPEGWAFGFGSYRWEMYKDFNYAVANYPDLNARTVRHIVGVPNHVRAWRRSAYEAAGGYSPEIHVADDYELILRTFLVTRFVHIRRFGYIQHLGETTAQRERNPEIQRLVRLFRQRYEEPIHERLIELTGEDPIWNDKTGFLDWNQPDPADGLKAANLTLY